MHVCIQAHSEERLRKSGGSLSWSGQGLHPSFLWIVSQSQTLQKESLDMGTSSDILDCSLLVPREPGSSSVTPRCEGEGALPAYGY